MNLFERRVASRLPKSIQTLSQRSLSASKHRCVSQRVRAGLCFTQFLNQVEEIRRVVGLKRNHEFLIIETKGIGSVKFDRAILGSYADVFVHHFLTLVSSARIPLARFHKGIDKKIIGLA